MRDKEGVFGGGDWTVGAFAVIPNPVSRNGKGPIVIIRQGDATRYLPMESDGDVVDLYRRVHGSPPEGLKRVQSEAYRAVWKKE